MITARLSTCLVQLYFPEGLTASDLLPKLAKRNVVVAGGLHAAIKGQQRCIPSVQPDAHAK